MVTDVDLVPCPEIIQLPQPVIVRPVKMVTFPCLSILGAMPLYYTLYRYIIRYTIGMTDHDLA